jgi:hypothetical protein
MRDYGKKKNGRPRRISARAQEGNPNWRAAVAAIPKGPRGRQCSAQRRFGRGKCHAAAVKGSNLCYMHGGWRALPKKRLEDIRKYRAHRYAKWSIPKDRCKNQETPSIKDTSTGYDM